MNRLACALLVLSACGSDTREAAPDAAPIDAAATDLAPPAQGFQIKTPEITIPGNTEILYCYYFKMPVTAEAGVKEWQSKMSPGSHHMILYFTQTEAQPEGTIDQCGSMDPSNLPVWTYAAQQEDFSQAMPDGVGMPVPAAQPAFIQMHYLNTTDAAITVHVTLNGNTFAATDSYTHAAAFVTYNTRIDVPPNSFGSAQGSCDVPGDVQFFTLSTHAHQHATETKVGDGDTVLFDSTDWAHPGSMDWASPYYTFTSGKLDYQCDYYNSTTADVTTGPSAQTDEMCMAIGYFFPATAPIKCINSTIVP
ncbi:MAG TPA: hypothetical protein VGM88_15005 [Kofleriaceae bacterium]|jgi:hypothetical protein